MILSSISDYKCLICEYTPNPENTYEAIFCGIIFCKECLLKWIAQKPKCPICKKELKDNTKYVRSIKNFIKRSLNLLLNVHMVAN